VTEAERNAARLAHESIAAGDPTGWFERLYAAAAAGMTEVPWDRHAPSQLLVDWATERAASPVSAGPVSAGPVSAGPVSTGPVSTGPASSSPGPANAAAPDHARTPAALVVGCGLGEDAEFIAGLGYRTVAFDISPSAIQAARERFPHSTVAYCVADLLAPPSDWRQAYDLVVEDVTLQALPDPPRSTAIANLGTLVAPGGTLIVLARGREPDDDDDGPPWSLTRTEIDAIATGGLRAIRIEQVTGGPSTAAWRWRAEFRRRGAADLQP
jgi:SAM-dependent methyltransferase